MINYFDKLYSSLNYRNHFLRQIKYYAIMRRILLNIINIILPAYFKITSDDPKYSIANGSKYNSVINEFPS